MLTFYYERRFSSTKHTFPIHSTWPYHSFVRSIFCVHCKLGCFSALFNCLLVFQFIWVCWFIISFCFPMCKNLCLYHHSLSGFICPCMVISLNIFPCLCVCVCVCVCDKYVFDMSYFARGPFSSLVSIRNLGQSYNTVFIWIGAMSLEDNQNSESGKYGSSWAVDFVKWIYNGESSAMLPNLFNGNASLF